jgi:hypothetical protein
MILHQGDWVLAYTGASPQPLAQTPIMRANDGGVFIDPGDVATVTLPVTNRGDGLAASTSVVLTSPTIARFPVSIGQPSSVVHDFAYAGARWRFRTQARPVPSPCTSPAS